MPLDAYVYTGLRSPFGRHAGALAKLRPDDMLAEVVAKVVADSGFTSRPALKALQQARIPFILGFSRSQPIRARLAALTGQQRRWLQTSGAIRLGWCPWDARLQLIASVRGIPPMGGVPGSM